MNGETKRSSQAAGVHKGSGFKMEERGSRDQHQWLRICTINHLPVFTLPTLTPPPNLLSCPTLAGCKLLLEVIRLTSFLWVWFQLSALWCPIATPTVLLGFLLSWMWGISSRILQQSAATDPYLGQGVSPHRRPFRLKYIFINQKRNHYNQHMFFQWEVSFFIPVE